MRAAWREGRIARQQEIDDSIAAKADYEYLYDKPYEDKRKVRVAGPFTVESLSPHRVLAVDENDELLDRVAEGKADHGPQQDFAGMIVEQLATAGVQQAHKEDRIAFAAVTPWPGAYICAEGRYVEGEGDSGPEKRAGIFVGPEFGTVSRPDLVAAAREAGDAGFDVLIACAFNYEAHASEFDRLGRIPILKARMNADLHMAGELKSTGKGNLFVIFGEPDIDVLPADTDNAEAGQLQVKINGVDVFHPNTGEVRSHGADGIACWFIDTDYNEESFFVRHAYFLWDHERRVVIKAEVVRLGDREPRDNPRFVVTNLRQTPRFIYEKVYCARGDIENRIKELLDGLQIDRTSCCLFSANQLRVFLTAAAYVLMQELRLRAARTACARSQVTWLRDRLLKLGVHVVRSVRRVVLHLPRSTPHLEAWRHIALALGARAG